MSKQKNATTIVCSAPVEVIELVRRFDEQLSAYKSVKYNETQLRRDFLDPLFASLGWDITNKQNYSEKYRDVIHEASVEVEGHAKAADYAFQSGGNILFFLEAKKPSVNLLTDPGPAFQIRRYGWSGRVPVGVVSDFEQLAVYDCRVKPIQGDTPAIQRRELFSYKDYVDKWDKLWNLLSKEAVHRGSLDQFIEKSKGMRGTADVDDDFLLEMERWRDLLAHNIALRNPTLSQREVNSTVQTTIDRIVFLRICEDRGIEPENGLRDATDGIDVYSDLMELFKKADKKYNSGLFHFENEKGQSSHPDMLTPAISIDDKVLKGILANLYPPKSPYAFKYFSADILGQVYERFLGKVITLSEGHRAKVEEKPEVRKAGGVYYTPTYIVDYIVKNTVGELLTDRTPETLETTPLRVLDPACGSGSFLLGAYQYLLDWYLDWYEQNDPVKWEKGKNPPICSARGGWQLTMEKKKEILTRHIYGVDIDSQAVEVTKLSLLLKVVENPGQLSLLGDRILPDLGNNIKCGNSLIGPDFYDGQQLSMFDSEEQYRVNAFDWQNTFPQVFAVGGFDAVIGNPPWGSSFITTELKYLRKKHERVVSRMIDSYIYFIDKSMMLSNKNGFVGLVVPSTVLNQVDTIPIRKILLSRVLTHVINLGQGVFGPKVLNTTTILISTNKEIGERVIIADLSKIEQTQKGKKLIEIPSVDRMSWSEMVSQDPQTTFLLGEFSAVRVFERLRKTHLPLQAYLTDEIQRGVTPDVLEAHIVHDDQLILIDPELAKLSISGRQIKRYCDWVPDQYLIYTSRDLRKEKYEKTIRWMEKFKHLNTCKEVKSGKHPWYALHRPRNPKIFNSPKFIGLTTTKKIEIIFDEKQNLVVTDAMYVFTIQKGINPIACLAVFSSKLFLFMYQISNQGESRVIPQIKATKLNFIPFPKLESEDARVGLLESLANKMQSLNKELTKARLPEDKERLERQIAITDHQIDSLVYKLYGLTDEEIKIVEGE